MIRKIRFSSTLIKELLSYCNTDTKHFTESGLWEYSPNLLYQIIQNRNNISTQVQNHLNDIFFNKIGLSYDDVMEVYKIIDLKKKMFVKYKQAVAVYKEKEEDSNNE